MRVALISYGFFLSMLCVLVVCGSAAMAELQLSEEAARIEKKIHNHEKITREELKLYMEEQKQLKAEENRIKAQQRQAVKEERQRQRDRRKAMLDFASECRYKRYGQNMKREKPRQILRASATWNWDDKGLFRQIRPSSSDWAVAHNALKKRSPVRDAYTAYKAGDFRYYNAIDPGKFKFSQPIGLECSAGTGRHFYNDAPGLSSFAEEQFWKEAEKYVEVYNRAMLAMPEHPEPHICLVHEHDKRGRLLLSAISEEGEIVDDVIRAAGMTRAEYRRVREKAETASIYSAAAFGHMDVVERSIRSFPRLAKKPDAYGWAPWQYAVWHKQTEMFRLLMERGVQVDGLDDEQKKKILELAIASRSVEVVKALLDYGLTVPEDYSLFHVFSHGTPDILDLILRQGVKPNYPKSLLTWSPYRGIPQHNPDAYFQFLGSNRHRSSEEKIQFLDVLFRHGATYNNGAGYSIGNDTAILEYMLGKGADPNVGYLLHSATARNDVEAIRLLLENGANPEDIHEDTPEHSTYEFAFGETLRAYRPWFEKQDRLEEYHRLDERQLERLMGLIRHRETRWLGFEGLPLDLRGDLRVQQLILKEGDYNTKGKIPEKLMHDPDFILDMLSTGLWRVFDLPSEARKLKHVYFAYLLSKRGHRSKANEERFKTRARESLGIDLDKIELERGGGLFLGQMKRAHENGLSLAGMGPDMQDNRAIVMLAVMQNGRALQYASERLRADPMVAWLALRQEVQAFGETRATRLNRARVSREKAKPGGGVFHLLPQNLKTERNFLLDALTLDPRYADFLDTENARQLLGLVLRKCHSDWKRRGGYEYVVQRYPADRTIVKGAYACGSMSWQKKESIFRYAAPELRGDGDFIMEIVKSHHCKAIIDADESLKNDREYLLGYLKKCPQGIAHVHDFLDHDMVIEVYKTERNILSEIPDSFLESEAFVRKAMDVSASILANIPVDIAEKLKDEIDCSPR